jgi:uncharacterized protein
MQLINFIKDKTNLPEKGIQHTIELLNEDCTLPFIARYRKERTGNLDEVEISDIIKFKEQFEELTKRKLSILKSLEEQGVLTKQRRKLYWKTYTCLIRKSERPKRRQHEKTDWNRWQRSS